MKYTDTLKKSTKESLEENISERLLELEPKSNHSIESKSLKFIVKIYCHQYKTCKVIA